MKTIGDCMVCECIRTRTVDTISREKRVTLQHTRRLAHTFETGAQHDITVVAARYLECKDCGRRRHTVEIDLDTLKQLLRFKDKFREAMQLLADEHNTQP